MVSSKKIIDMARKWKKLAMISRKRITFTATVDKRFETSTIDAGHFVVYTADHKRFVIPLDYLNNEIIKEFLEMAKEEFGHPSKGAITVPCDSICMEYVVSLIRRQVSEDLEKALIITLTNARCSSTSNVLEGLDRCQLPICVL